MTFVDAGAEAQAAHTSSSGEGTGLAITRAETDTDVASPLCSAQGWSPASAALDLDVEELGAH
jgi:hypothetical protein